MQDGRYAVSHAGAQPGIRSGCSPHARDRADRHALDGHADQRRAAASAPGARRSRNSSSGGEDCRRLAPDGGRSTRRTSNSCARTADCWRAWRAWATTIRRRCRWRTAGTISYVRAARVTGEFFGVLGVEPLLGRALGPEDNVAGAENVLVLTHALWQARYGGARDVLGRRVSVGGQPFTIVGVMPRDVEHPRRVEVWMTVDGMLTTTSNPTAKLGITTEFDMLARVKPAGDRDTGG